MQDRPDARELIEAVGGFLEKELIPAISDPRLRFRSLVAANVLAIVERELQAGSQPLRDEWERLLTLLGKPDLELPKSDHDLASAVLELNAEVSARIRAGEFDEEPRFSAALKQAEATVIEKLRVANPRYLERVSRDEHE